MFSFCIVLMIVYCVRRSQGDVTDKAEAMAGDMTRAGAFIKKAEERRNTIMNVFTKIQVPLKILMAYAQIASGFSFNYNLRFPSPFPGIMEIYAIANLDFLNLAPIGCIVPTSFYISLMGYTIVPLVIVGFLAALSKLLGSQRYANDKAKMEFQSFVFNSMLLFTFFVLPSTSTKVMNAFNCDYMDGGDEFLKLDLSIDCNSWTHFAFQGYAIAMIVVFPFGVPFMYFRLLYRVHHLLNPGQDKLRNSCIVQLVVIAFEEVVEKEGASERRKVVEVAKIVGYIIEKKDTKEGKWHNGTVINVREETAEVKLDAGETKVALFDDNLRFISEADRIKKQYEERLLSVCKAGDDAVAALSLFTRLTSGSSTRKRAELAAEQKIDADAETQKNLSVVSPNEQSCKYCVGDKVQLFFEIIVTEGISAALIKGVEYRPGIDYDLAEVKTRKKSKLEKVVLGKLHTSLGMFGKGEKVEARSNDDTTFYPGTISRHNSDDTYDIEFDDGLKELSVSKKHIKKIVKKSRRSSSSSPSRRSSVDVDKQMAALESAPAEKNNESPKNSRARSMSSEESPKNSRARSMSFEDFRFLRRGSPSASLEPEQPESPKKSRTRRGSTSVVSPPSDKKPIPPVLQEYVKSMQCVNCVFEYKPGPNSPVFEYTPGPDNPPISTEFILGIEVTLDEEGAMQEAIRRRDQYEKTDHRLSRIKFLYQAYEPNCWWFEVFETFRRLLLTGGQVFMNPGTASQIVLNMLICLFSMRVYAQYQPYIEDKNDRLAEIAQWQLFFTMFAALCIKVDITHEDGYNQGMFAAGLGIIQLIAPAFLVYQMWLSRGNGDTESEGAEGSGVVGALIRLTRAFSDAKDAYYGAKEEVVGFAGVENLVLGAEVELLQIFRKKGDDEEEKAGGGKEDEKQEEEEVGEVEQVLRKKGDDEEEKAGGGKEDEKQEDEEDDDEIRIEVAEDSDADDASTTEATTEAYDATADPSFWEPENLFDVFDADKNGTIDLDELVVGLTVTLQRKVSLSEASEKLAAYDTDLNGSLSKEEFVSLVADMSGFGANILQWFKGGGPSAEENKISVRLARIKVLEAAFTKGGMGKDFEDDEDDSDDDF